MKSPFCWLAVSLVAAQCALAATPKAEEVKDDPLNKPGQSPSFKVRISTHFPNSEQFGVKLVNGKQNEAVLSIDNQEPTPVTLQFVGGNLSPLDLDPTSKDAVKQLRNLTTLQYKTEPLPAGQNASYTYKFSTNVHPADLRLVLAAVVINSEGNMFNIPAFNGTVSIVEAPVSFFDPQILFLYVILGAAFAGVSYFIYTTWFGTLFPQKKRGGKAGGPKTPRKKDGIVDPAAQSPGATEPSAASSGAQVYDQSWIPASHLQRPEAKRIRSGTPTGAKTKSRQA